MTAEPGKRKTESMALISSALLKMTQCRKLADISVSELCTEATVSRNTFYRLFHSVDDVVDFLINAKLKTIMERYETIGEEARMNPTREMMCAYYGNFFRVWADEKEFLKTIVSNDLEARIYNCMPEAFLNKASESKIRSIAIPRYEEYYYAALSGMLTAVLLAWVRGGFKNSPEEMGEAMVHIVESYQVV